MPNRRAARKKIQRHKAVLISLAPAAGSSLVLLIRDGSPWPVPDTCAGEAGAGVLPDLVALGVDVGAGVLVVVGALAGVFVAVARAVDVAAASVAVDVGVFVAADSACDAMAADIGTLVAVAGAVDVAAGSVAVDVGIAVAADFVAADVGTLVAAAVGSAHPTRSCAGVAAGVIADPWPSTNVCASQLSFASPFATATNCTVAAVPLPDATPPGLSAYA
jgi:hypothetical protein